MVSAPPGALRFLTVGGGPVPGGLSLASPALDPLLAEAQILLRSSKVIADTWRSGDVPTNEGSAAITTTSVPTVDGSSMGPVLLDPGDGAYQAIHFNTFSPAGFSTPDSVAIDIAGDLDLRARGKAINDSSIGDLENRVAFLARITNLTSDPGYDDLSYELSIHTTGADASTVGLIWVDTSNVQHALSSDVAQPLDPYEFNEVRATLDVDNGAGGHTANFYVRDDADPDVTTTDLKGWRLLRTVTAAGVTDIRDTSGPLVAAAFPSIVTYAEAYDGIDGTRAVNFDPADAAGWKLPTGTWTAAGTGETWTARAEAYVVPVAHVGWLNSTEQVSASHAAFSIADTAAIDLGLTDATLVLLATVQNVANTNFESLSYVNKSSGPVGQGGTGWGIRDVQVAPVSVNGAGFLGSDGAHTVSTLGNAASRWTAARHLIVITLDRDGSATVYVDDMATPLNSASMATVGDLSTATALVLGGDVNAPHLLEAYAQWGRLLDAGERARIATLLGA